MAESGGMAWAADRRTLSLIVCRRSPRRRDGQRRPAADDRIKVAARVMDSLQHGLPRDRLVGLAGRGRWRWLDGAEGRDDRRFSGNSCGVPMARHTPVPRRLALDPHHHGGATQG
jgi:hypothetical protein